jgi:magnesium-transporting ATPase (P-type)
MGELLFSATVLLYSIFSVLYIVMPINDYLKQNVFPNHSVTLSLIANTTGYDIATEDKFNVWHIASLVAYLSMGVFCLALDYVLPVSCKTQGHRSYFTWREVWDAMSLGLFNICICAFIFTTVPYVYLWKFADHDMREDSPWDFKTEAFKFVLSFGSFPHTACFTIQCFMLLSTSCTTASRHLLLLPVHMLIPLSLL